jgi:hypothetical protein
MNPQQQSSRPHSEWQWPLNSAIYDRSPMLSEKESAELEYLVQAHHQAHKRTRSALHRLLQPIDDVLTYTKAPWSKRPEIVRVLLVEMQRRHVAFWGWTLEQWQESIGPNQRAFVQRYGLHGRHYLPLLAYLLEVLPDASPLFELVQIPSAAQKIFGKEVIDEAVERLMAILRSWGYQQKKRQPFIACVCYVLLRNKSPRLEDLSSEVLEGASQMCKHFSVRRHLLQMSQALFALGLIKTPLPDVRGERLVVSGVDGSVSEEWLAFCQRWRKLSTAQDRTGIYYQLLKVGRWLKAVHPEVTGPAQWTYELAAEFVAAVSQMKVGEWIDTHRLRVPARRVGQPLRPRAKIQILQALRVFLRDCQEWTWIPVSFNPDRALRTPRSLYNLVGPDPRVVEKSFWAKILWAAMNLEEDDLPVNGSDAPGYPLELVRAIALVWCFAALRNDELVRLRVGCIRWQYEDVMVPETGEILPKDATCFLDIPVNKTMTAYTKPVHPLVGKRINEWERLRPSQQPPMLDRKTSEAVAYVFAYRGKRISKTYVNHCLIPLLCCKAGVPVEDSRGKITSHRARATIASMLYNAKEPLSIFQLKEYLGHKKLSSTQSYLQVDPTKLASQVVKAGYLEQNLATVEVLLDQEAVLNGAASRGESWKYYDLGHGWCANPFWASCAHRMACAKCPFYRPKTGTMDQLVEGKANLVRMLEFVSLTEDEKLLVTEGIELHQELIEKLVDVPTPAGPTPRELEAQRQGEMKDIPIKTVRRNKKAQ